MERGVSFSHPKSVLTHSSGVPGRTRIALGLPVGGELEYADAATVAKAMEGRKDI